MRKVFWLCLPAAVLFVLLPGAAAARTAAGPSCGATITTSITLHANLDCSAVPGNGLIVGASGIVIKLNGFSIIGSGGGSGGDVGIFNGGFSNVTVNGHKNGTKKNGTIRNFYYDYYSSAAQGETVTKVHLVLDGSHTYYGLYTYNGNGNTRSYVTVKNAYFGIYDYQSSGEKFAHNTLTDNEVGALAQFGLNSTWTTNNISSNASSGLEVDLGAGSTILTGNTASHNGSIGLYLNCNGVGNVVAKSNTANSNGGGGIASQYCSSAPSFSTFTSNTASHNVGVGISSTADTNATFNLNTANANTTNGFNFAFPDGYVITKNVSNGNGSDGVYFHTGNGKFPSLVTMNTSSSNTGFGYNADFLVTGSGNHGTLNISGLFNNVSG